MPQTLQLATIRFEYLSGQRNNIKMAK